MNGENVSMKPCNRLQDNRQKPRFIVHLDNKGDRLSPCLFMKWKNIIFVFVERASADLYHLCGFLHRLHFTGIQQPLRFHNSEQYLRHGFCPQYEERCLLAHPDFLPYVLSVYDRHLCSLERFYHKNINLARGIGDLSPIFTLSAFRSWSRNFHC